MCTMKKKFQMIGFALSVLLVTLPIVTVVFPAVALVKN